VLLARETLAQDENDLKWTRDLYDKEFVSRNDLREDELSVTRSRVNVATAEEELRLYRLYTLPKEVEQRHADYVETVRDLKRVEARARSELAQKEAEKKSKQASLQLEKERFEKAELMMSKATITAPVPGRVVYASTTDAWRRMRDPMQEGKNVRENESLIVIPDISTLAARVNIHETDVEKVRIGQPALISVEAMPDRPLPGKVARISPVASAAHAWLNPDIKVYDTDVTLDEVPEGLTPGMSATAEIVVADLRNVLYVPIEAVNTHRGERVCWVKKADGQPELRPVECGHFTDKFVEITKGLSEGEQVYLEPPVTLPETEADNQPRKLEIEVKPVDDQALPEVEEEEEVSDSGYVTPDGMIDWQKLMAAIQPLIDSGKWTELSAKMAEIRESLPEELRPEFDAAIKKGQEQYAAATGGG
ncbi:MAG: efflux RND transporter periplasmic adaptor subunit, partial [Candidatus Eisenbacteria bacterium]|nr:efflux RND transporter periplasmic adaptor subunit [Candidatus Eisenbacteria bacterium]